MKSKLGAALLCGAAMLVIPQAQASEGWKFHYDHVLGTSLDIVAVARDENIAQFAAQTVRTEIQRLDALLSGWRPDSELNALNVSASFVASPDLFHVIAASEYWRQMTGGAFSARLGTLEMALKAGQGQLGELAMSVNNAVLNLDSVGRRIQRPDAIRFAVDGLAKGYIVDRALETARGLPGVTGLMVDIGGDLRCWGRAPSGDGWQIGVVNAANCADNAAPVAILKLTDQAVATSGRGNRVQTIFNPLTGQKADHVAMATVVADRAADADALASAFSVMAPSNSIALAEKLPGVAAHIVTRDGQVYQTCNLAEILVAQANTASRPAANAKGPAWPAGFSLKIDYEVPDMGGGRRPHPPYITIWVTDADGNLVRTLAFYANKERYMPENYVFWNRFGASQADKVYAVTRPTRPPGRYTLDWDGLDDRGQPVGQGKYTINIEAAREHGGHAIQRIDMNLGTASMRGAAQGQGELGASQALYGNSK